jgi:hypothetical protein
MFAEQVSSLSQLGLLLLPGHPSLRYQFVAVTP